MPGSVTSLLSGAKEFLAALRNEGSLNLFVTVHGQFRARVTQVELHCMRLSAVEEQLSRIAFVAVPADLVLVTFPIGNRPAPISGGMRPEKGEFMTFGPGHRAHVRTQEPCHWGAIWFSAQELTGHLHRLTECALTIPPSAQKWHPPLAAHRRLLRLHAAAIRAAEVRPETIVNAEAAHGMEQQLIEALVECTLGGPLREEGHFRHRRQGIMAQLEDLLETQQDRHTRAEYFSIALGVSGRLLRMCCKDDLGMGLIRYIRLRALHRINRILRGAPPGATSVSQVARCHGFHDLRCFAVNYRSLFGELPSATLRRNLRW
jgi:AraC-like DNA-binding protein